MALKLQQIYCPPSLLLFHKAWNSPLEFKMGLKIVISYMSYRAITICTSAYSLVCILAFATDKVIYILECVGAYALPSLPWIL